MKKTLFVLLAILATSSLFAQSSDPCDTGRVTFTYNVCEGDSIFISGTFVHAPGIYHDTLFTTSGCDSIVTYIINANPRYEYFNTATICQGDSFLFQGQYYYGAGHYTSNYHTTSECDSIYHLYLNVTPTYHYVEYYTTCQGTPYNFRGRTLTQSGVYYDTLTSESGCDSIYELNLTVYPTSRFPLPRPKNQIITLCYGETYTYRGKNYTESGTYYDTIISSHGCDSIISFTLNFLPRTDVFDTISACDSALYHGQYFTAAGNYTIYNSDSSGCDTIYHLHLTLFAPSHDTIHIDTCQDAIPIMLNGKRIYESGIYTDTLLSYSYCDSIVTYIVNFFPSYEHSDTLILCEGDEYEFCGYTYYATRSGTYICGAKSVHGCDSTIRLCLTVLDCNSTTALDNASLYDITLLPNPTSGISYLYADFPDDQLDGMRVDILTPAGILLNTIYPTQLPLAIPAINAPGTYFVRITTTSGATHIRKLLVH